VREGKGIFNNNRIATGRNFACRLTRSGKLLEAPFPKGVGGVGGFVGGFLGGYCWGGLCCGVLLVWWGLGVDLFGYLEARQTTLHFLSDEKKKRVSIHITRTGLPGAEKSDGAPQGKISGKDKWRHNWEEGRLERETRLHRQKEAPTREAAYWTGRNNLRKVSC